jgi:hypothetical protein
MTKQIIYFNNNNMTRQEIYNELRMIDEYNATFNANEGTKARMRELIAMLPISKYDRVR